MRQVFSSDLTIITQLQHEVRDVSPHLEPGQSGFHVTLIYTCLCHMHRKSEANKKNHVSANHHETCILYASWVIEIGTTSYFKYLINYLLFLMNIIKY